jgi:hypothetical protein
MEQCKTCIYKDYKDILTACSLNELNNKIGKLNYQVCKNIPIIRKHISPKEEYRCNCYESKWKKK